MTNADLPDPAPPLAAAVRRLFEHGEYVGPERTFDERCAAFIRQAEPLGESGQMIIEFMETSVQDFGPLLRAISDLGLLASIAKGNEQIEWQPIATRVRQQLSIAEQRYPDPAAIHFAVPNLKGVLEDAERLLQSRA